MHTLIVVLVLTLLAISAAAALSSRLKIPAPLILVVAGIAASFVPGAPEFVLDPEIMLIGLLPPLLYASATALPVMNLRRDMAAINLLSVLLVVVSALGLGLLFTCLVPDLGFGWGVALGAILSPTDAVATRIFKGTGAPGRVAVLLDGESLLNDASALIVLRTALVATSVGFSFWPTLGSFALAVGVAVIVGRLAAVANLAVRRRVRDEALNTLLSFTTPFAAAVLAEALHGSGLVAAVVAGFVVSTRAPRVLPPGHRVSDAQNWATVEIGLEGVVFLTMGLQLSSIIKELGSDSIGVGGALVIALAALAATLVLRTAFVVPLLSLSQRRAQAEQARQPKLAVMQQELEAGRVPAAVARRARRFGMDVGERMLQLMTVRMRRYLADLDYFSRQPLGAAEKAIVIWAGMRGAVTVAAAQLLPASTPHRPLLVFIAFAVAALSLVVQGGTIGLLAARLFPAPPGGVAAAQPQGHRDGIRALLDEACAAVARAEGASDKQHQMALLAAQRSALLDARDDGMFDADALAQALRDIDIDEIVLELRGDTPTAV